MIINTISFNIHKGIGWKTPRSTLFEIQDQIHLLQPDFVLIQEVKGYQVDVLAQGIWPHVSYGKNVISTKGHHGNAILSKLPVTNTHNIDITTAHFEKRGMLHAQVILSTDQRLHLLCVHLGLFKKDRIKQLNIIANYITNNIADNDPIILAGDFNDWGEIATPIIIKKLNFIEAFMNINGVYARTFPSWAPLLKLDRIYIRGLTVIKSYRIIQKPWTSLSDHIALYAKLNLG